MILAHARLKSRAKALLKFMKVAWVLRDMEDFHSLVRPHVDILRHVLMEGRWRCSLGSRCSRSIA